MEKSIGDGMKLSKRDIKAAEILVEWNHEYWRRIPPFNWGCKRRRSFTFTAMPHNGSTDGGAVVAPCSCYAKSQTMVKRESSRPALPPDKKPNTSQRKRSLKRKKDNHKTAKHLTKNKASLNQEIDNVERHHNQPNALILKLKLRKQEPSNGPENECQNTNLETAQPMKMVHANDSVNASKSTAENKGQKQQQMHIPNHNQMFGPSQTTTLQMPSTSTLGQGPLPILDLNVSPKGFIHVDSYEQLDATVANEDLSRNMAAQARQRRILIFRHKKSIGNSKP